MREVLRPDRGRQAVLRRVGHRDGVFLVREGVQRHERAKGLGLREGRVDGEAADDRRREPVSAAVRLLGREDARVVEAAAQSECAFGGSGRRVEGRDLAALVGGDERAEVGRGVGGRAKGELRGGGGKGGGEALVEAVGRLLDEDARGAEADLARVEEGRAHGTLDGEVEVAVGEDEQRVLAAELEGELREARRDRRGDRRARRSPSGEGERAYLRVQSVAISGKQWQAVAISGNQSDAGERRLPGGGCRARRPRRRRSRARR